jgi:hypothetical protein
MRKVVENFTGRFPNSPLSGILLHEPQELPTEAFLSKVQTWLTILDSEKIVNGIAGKKEEVKP